MSSTNSELILSLLSILQKGDSLGFGWSSKLNFLLRENAITQEQFDDYTSKHLNIRKGIKDSVKDQVKCKLCDDVINAGTYGIIFNSNRDKDNVIKGSIKGHSITTGCPDEFEHEIIMYSKIYDIFTSLELGNIKMIKVYNRWVENRRCYYEMDKIYPFIVSQELKNTIDLFIASNPYYAIPLNDFKSGNYLFLLKPGNKNENYYFSEGVNFSNWKEIGENLLKTIFSLVNYQVSSYYLSLFYILDLTIKNNILLFDVEFVLGSVKIGDTFENGIFMIDFDKTQHRIFDATDIELLLRQETIPQYSKDLVNQELLKLKEKYKINNSIAIRKKPSDNNYFNKYIKYKKKYFELKKYCN